PDLLADVPCQERRVGVTVDAVDERRDVDVDDVPVTDHRGVGDTVADHLVERDTARLGERLVPQGRRVRPVVAQELVYDPVDLVGRHAGRDRLAGEHESVRGEPGGHAHHVDDLSRLNPRLPVGLVDAVAPDVLRPGDRLGDGPDRGGFTWDERLTGGGGHAPRIGPPGATGRPGPVTR